MNETRRPADRETSSLRRNTSRDPGYRAGDEDGFATGAELGRAWAEAEMAQAWHAVAARVRRSANSPTYAELHRRRNHYPQPARTPEQIIAAARASWADVETEAKP